MFFKNGIYFFAGIIAVIAVTALSYNYFVSSGGNNNPFMGKNVNAADLDLKKISLPAKTLGNPDAPVVMHEFSSLTCGHCGSFHTNNLPIIKEEYIDTGKVFYVYHEFPLDGAALDAATLARCADNDNQFWNLTDMFFIEQKNWLKGDYQTAMKRMVKLAGYSDEKIESCLGNRDLKRQIAESSQIYAQKYEINSTPSFVFNDFEDKITGNAPIADFRIKIEKLLQNSQ